ncbi:MAG: hypothetical protein LAP85_05145 [Acidobacteriia bacterium]|nr:hypothetical protein [Terriglobia bacterium]
MNEIPYDGALERIERLGLNPILDQVRSLLTDFTLLVKEERDANGGAAVRKLIDAQFERAGGWTKKQTGGVDWTKCLEINGAKVCVGVEVQFSARSDLVVVDLIHLRKSVVDGKIDVGILIVPDDQLGVFLTDRGPNLADALKHIVEARVEDLPLIVIALRHDGAGPSLAKQPKNRKKAEP